MTKREAVQIFRAEVLPEIDAQYGKDDIPARCGAWNNWTDALCKQGQITAKQYNEWVNPF